jgi:DNA polymerase-1
LLHKYATLEDAFADGQLASQAEQLRVYRRIATMDRAAPLPALGDQTPTWDKAAALARDWDLGRLAARLDELAAA